MKYFCENDDNSTYEDSAAENTAQSSGLTTRRFEISSTTLGHD